MMLVLAVVCNKMQHSARLSSSAVHSFFNYTATTEIYTLSLHDALPIYLRVSPKRSRNSAGVAVPSSESAASRSEEHTSELQSLTNLVCRLLLEKKKIKDSRYFQRERQHSV